MAKKDSHFIPSPFKVVTEYENKFISEYNTNLSGAVADVLKYIAKSAAVDTKDEDIDKAQENDIEKGHNVGDMHSNGKWVWKQLPSGKYDWRNVSKSDAKPAAKKHEINDEAQAYIDIISLNPKLDKYQKYKDLLKTKFDINYDELDKDDSYIQSANLKDIKHKTDFLNFDNYIKYAKKIYQLRNLEQPVNLDIEISFDEAEKITRDIKLKLVLREYNGGSGNIAGHDLIDTISMPSKLDANTFVHELGHHYDHFESKGYKGFAKTITHASSPYEISKSNEVFAENFMHYFIAPDWLKKELPTVFEELDKKINSRYKKLINEIIKPIKK